MENILCLMGIFACCLGLVGCAVGYWYGYSAGHHSADRAEESGILGGVEHTNQPDLDGFDR